MFHVSGNLTLSVVDFKSNCFIIFDGLICTFKALTTLNNVCLPKNTLYIHMLSLSLAKIIFFCFVLCFTLKAFGCIDQDRDGVIKKQDLRETYGQLGIFFVFLTSLFIVTLHESWSS